MQRMKESVSRRRIDPDTIKMTWHYHCPRCSAAIPREYTSVRHQYFPRPVTKRVQAWCPACQRGVQVTFTAGAGGWEREGDVQVLPEAAAQAIQAHASRINGGDHAA